MNKLFSTISALAVASVTALYAPASGAQEVKGDPVAGQKKIAMCIGCHGIVGYQASFPEIHKVPKISGQGAKYIVAALNEYKTAARKHPTMRAIAVAEAWHEKRYTELANNIKAGHVFCREKAVTWRCRNCGYLHEGTAAPSACAACAHPQAYFELRDHNW